MTKKQKKVAKFLESLVGQRFNMITLKEVLSEFFKEDIKIDNISQQRLDKGMDDELTDYNLMFNSVKKKTYGYYDIYMLPMRRVGYEGSDMYITEVDYEFE